jgi:hypothetical protein
MMLNVLYLIVALSIATKTDALICSTKCSMGNCTSLSYFMQQCSQCKTIKPDCAAKFCHNHPNLCDNGTPLQDLSINTHRVDDKGKFYDICMARLFPPMTLLGHSNTDLTIDNLNATSITAFAQTGNNAYQRNLGIIKKLLANFIVYENPTLKDNQEAISRLIDQDLLVRYHVNANKITLEQFHNIADDLRSRIFNLKGIDTKSHTETHNSNHYQMTISNMGCISEK